MHAASPCPPPPAAQRPLQSRPPAAPPPLPAGRLWKVPPPLPESPPPLQLPAPLPLHPPHQTLPSQLLLLPLLRCHQRCVTQPGVQLACPTWLQAGQQNAASGAAWRPVCRPPPLLLPARPAAPQPPAACVSPCLFFEATQAQRRSIDGAGGGRLACSQLHGNCGVSQIQEGVVLVSSGRLPALLVQQTALPAGRVAWEPQTPFLTRPSTFD